MSKKRILQGVNDGQNFNPADFTPYQSVNTPTNDFSTGDVNTYDYKRDSNLDRSNITPYDLPSLNDTRAENQGILSSLGNDVGKFVGKTALNIVGGVAGTVYGVGSAIAEGNVSNIWDNSFTAKVDDIDKGLDNIFKVYKSSDYLQQNILQRAFLHPLQFIDDTADALSFTAGAILTELATAGIATELLVPKAMKYMKFLSQGAEAAEATQELTSLTRGILRGAGDFGKVTRQLATGSSYESIVEARKATMDLRNKMYADYAIEHPNQDIPESVKADIDDRLSKAGMFTYLTNLALVGSSNMAQFPKIFGLGYNSSKVAGDIAKNAETGLYETAKKQFKDLSLLGKAGVILKNPLREGLYEEGLQNVTSATNQQFFDRKNDGKYKSIVDGYLSTVANNLANTYSSKEGWNDIGMGMLIGGLGAPGRGALAILGKNNPVGRYGYENVTNDRGEITGQKRQDIWTGGIVGAAEEHNTEASQVQSVVDDLNKHTSLFKSMKANYDFLVQSQSLQDEKEKAVDADDIFGFNNAKDDQIHAYTAARIKASKYEDILDTISDMKKMSPDEFYSEFRGEEAANNATVIEKTKFQHESIQEFTEKAANTKEAYDIVDNNYKGDNDNIREELAHSIAAAKNLDVREQAINQSLADLSSGMISNYSLRGNHEAFLKGSINTIKEQLKEENLSQEDSDLLSKQLVDFTRTLQSPELSALHYLRENNPTAYTLNGSKIVELLSDSKKLREKRQNYLDLYNHLFTKEGQKQFEQHIQEIKDAKVKKEEEKVAKETKAQAEEIKKQNVKETVEKVKNPINTRAIANEDIPNVNFDEELSRAPEEIVSDIAANADQHIEALANEDEQTAGETLIKEDLLKDELDKSVNTIVPEEKAVVAVEDHKELVTQRDVIFHEDGLVRNDTISPSRRLGDLTIINLDRKRTKGNTIAYLGQDKITLNQFDENEDIVQKTYNTFNEDGSVQINENVDIKLFSQNYYKPGDKLILKVPTFVEMQERGLQSYTEINYLDDINNPEEFPIGIYSEDKLIGYLPTQSGVDRLVADEFKDKALASNKSLRDTIFENKDDSYNSVITSKSPGFLILDHPDNQKSLFEALGDKTKLVNDVKLVIPKLGELYTNNTPSGRYTNNIVNPPTINDDGIIFSIVPSSEKEVYVAYPMKVNTIGIDNANTIVEAIRLFAKGDNLTTKEKQSLDNITEFNFKNFDDVTAFVNKIMYASSKDNASDYTTFKLFKNNLYLSRLEDQKFSIQSIIDSADVRAQIAQILSNRYYSVSLDSLNSKKGYISYSLEDGVIKENEHPNYQHYLNETSAITSNIRGIQIEGNDFAFTTQPVISISDKLTRELVPNKLLEQATPIEEVIERPKSTKKVLFDPNKVKPKSFEDINPEFIEQQNIKSGKDLRRKCL